MKINTNSCSVFDIKILPEQNSFACALIEAPIKIYNLDSGQEILTIKDRNYDSAWTLDFFKIAENSYLVAGYGTNGYLKIFDSKGDESIYNPNREEFTNTAPIHSNSIWQVQQFNNQIFSVSDDGKIAKFKLEKLAHSFDFEKKLVQKVKVGKNAYAFCIWNEETIFVSNEKNEIKKVDFSTLKATKFLKAHEKRIISMIKKEDNQLVTLSWDNTIKIWDENGKLIISCETKSESKLQVLENQLITSENNKIVFRNIETLLIEKEIQSTLGNIRAFDILNNKIVCGDEHGFVEVIF